MKGPGVYRTTSDHTQKEGTGWKTSPPTRLSGVQHVCFIFHKIVLVTLDEVICNGIEPNEPQLQNGKIV